MKKLFKESKNPISLLKDNQKHYFHNNPFNILKDSVVLRNPDADLGYIADVALDWISIEEILKA